MKWAGRSDNIIVKILSLPGLYLQKITTREPDKSQLEVAIAAIEAVCDDRPAGSRIIKKKDIGKTSENNKDKLLCREVIEEENILTQEIEDERGSLPLCGKPLKKRRFI